MKIGDRAPEFTLINYDGQPFSLSEQLEQGPVVLIFYPLDQSPVCTRLMCSVNDEISQFKEAGLRVVGINWAEASAHRRFAGRKQLRMPLLTDESYFVSKAYDALLQVGPFKFIRYVIVGIGRDGLVKFYEHGRPDNASIIAGMKAA